MESHNFARGWHQITANSANSISGCAYRLLRHAERKLGICRRIADTMADRRDSIRIRHAVFEMVMARLGDWLWSQGMPSTRPAAA
jgi:hypothetical protein